MKKYEELTFTDDYMFCKILQQDEDLCKRLVEVIIGRKIGKIIKNDKQKPIDVTSDGKGIRMDVYLEDDQNSVYNIEMQNVNTKDIAKRARYYQSMLDVGYLKKSWEYGKLKKSYVIFINQFDMFKENLPMYTFTNRCHEKEGIEMGDETTKIFLNTKGICGTIEPELEALLTYMCNGQPSSDLTKDIEAQIVEARTNSCWRGDFMTLYENYQIEREEGRREGLKEGREQGCCNAVSKLVEKGYSVEDACRLLEYDIEEYKSFFKKQRN